MSLVMAGSATWQSSENCLKPISELIYPMPQGPYLLELQSKKDMPI